MTHDLWLWRHAQAHDLAPGQHDAQRPLTPLGQQQAARMAGWLHAQLPAHARVLVSPAVRARQTADALAALGRPYQVLDSLRPETSARHLLQAAGWPYAASPVLLVGHQPSLGQAVAWLLGMAQGACSVQKGAVWRLRGRLRGGVWQTVVRAVQGPDTLPPALP